MVREVFDVTVRLRNDMWVIGYIPDSGYEY